MLILTGVGDSTDDTIFQTEFLKSKAKLTTLLPIDAFVLVIKFDKEESKGFFSAAKQFVQFFGRLGIQSLMIICIQANEQMVFSSNKFQNILLQSDGYKYLKEKNSDFAIPYCLWDNIRPPADQETNFLNCLKELKPFNKIYFEYSCDMLQNDIYRIEELQNWLTDSAIMNRKECLSLIKMTNCKVGVLLYRATRDTFQAAIFHKKCDGVKNTITIIRNNLDYVFGGYASAPWNSAGQYINDPNAFIFTLRRNGIFESNKYMIKAANVGNGLYGQSEYAPTFGGHDIYINNNSNVTVGSYCNFGHSYSLPDNIVYGTDNAKTFLAGNYNQWLTTEIEVYQIN